MSTLNPASTWLSLSAEVAQRQASLRSLARPRRKVRDDAPAVAARPTARCAPAPRAKAA